MIYSGDGLTAEQLLANARDVFDMTLPDMIQVLPYTVDPPINPLASRAVITALPNLQGVTFKNGSHHRGPFCIHAQTCLSGKCLQGEAPAEEAPLRENGSQGSAAFPDLHRLAVLHDCFLPITSLGERGLQVCIA